MVSVSPGVGLSRRRISTGPILPANNQFAMFGDSRGAQGHPGLPFGLLLNGFASIGVQGALLMKTGGLISFEPEISNYGISGNTITQMAVVPRATAALGADVLAAANVPNIIILGGVNNLGDAGLAVAGTLWNEFISILNRWTTKYRIYILNEIPVGKTAAGGLSGTMTVGQAAVHYQFSRDLLKLDRASGDALSRPNCVVINSYDALLDAASGANRYNTVGMLSDGVHLSPTGASTIANLMTASINATYPTAQRDPAKANLMTVKDNSVLCLNSLMAVVDDTNHNTSAIFASINGGSGATGSQPQIPDYWNIAGSNCSDIALTISKAGFDDEGYPALQVGWSRGATGIAGDIIVTCFPDVLAVQQAKYTTGQKLRFQSKIKLDSPVGVSGLLCQGTLRTTGGDDVGSITTLGHATGGSGLPVVAMPWMSFEGRNGDSTTVIANSTQISSGNHACKAIIQFDAGATSGTFYVSRMTLRRFA